MQCVYFIWILLRPHSIVMLPLSPTTRRLPGSDCHLAIRSPVVPAFLLFLYYYVFVSLFDKEYLLLKSTITFTFVYIVPRHCIQSLGIIQDAAVDLANNGINNKIMKSTIYHKFLGVKY